MRTQGHKIKFKIQKKKEKKKKERRSSIQGHKVEGKNFRDEG